MVRRHPTPLSPAVGSNIAQTLNDVFLVARIQKTLHFWLPHYVSSTHFPLPPLSTRASITFILATASSIGVGTGVSLMTASENRSPWIVYWSQMSKLISSTPAEVSCHILQGRSGGALNGISI